MRSPSRERIDAAIAALAGVHTRLCPRQVLGVRIGLHAVDLLGVPLPMPSTHLFAWVETDGCFVDGVSAATGCTLGHRNLRLLDHGKVALTLVDRATRRAVRVWPREDARDRAALWPAPDAWHAQRDAYREMEAGALLRAAEVPGRLPEDAPRAGHAPRRVRCAACAEEVLNGREVFARGLILCRACAGSAGVDDLLGTMEGLHPEATAPFGCSAGATAASALSAIVSPESARMRLPAASARITG